MSTKALAARLRRAGFDKTRAIAGRVYPRCSQCEALCVQGAAVHEHGCPNARSRQREEESA